MNQSTKQFFGALLFSAISSLACAQPSLTWAKAIGEGTPAGSTLRNSIAVDASGNVYVTGNFSGTADFDPGPGVANLTSYGGADGFLAKYNANGNYLWAVHFGGASSEYAFRLAVDQNSNVYVCGYFSGTANFGSVFAPINLTSSGSNDGFFCKYTSSGSISFARKIGGAGNDYIRDIVLNSSNEVFLCGYFSGSADFDPGAGVATLTSASGSFDAFYGKYTSSGNYVWAQKIGGNNTDIAMGITADASSCYVTGYTTGAVDFDPGAGTAIKGSSGSNGYVAKYSNTGSYQVAITLEGGSCLPSAIHLKGTSNIIVSGTYSGTVDFDPYSVVNSRTSVGATSDIFLASYSTGGNLVYAHSIGNSGADSGENLFVHPVTGAAYVTGYFNNTVDFNPGPATASLTSAGSNAGFCAKYDASGNYVWAFPVTSSGCAGYGVTAMNSHVYFSGNYTGTPDMQPTSAVVSLPAGQNDIYLAKYCTGVPNQPGAMTGPSAVCEGQPNLVYSVPADPEADSYTWILPSGWTGSSTTNTITVTAGQSSGTVMVRANNGCGSSTYSSMWVSLGAIPTITVTSTGPICIGNSATLTASGASVYLWADASTLNYATTPTVIATPSVTTTYTVTGATGQCTGTATVTVQVNPLPDVTVSGPSLICPGMPTTLTASGADYYSWQPGYLYGSSVSVAPTVTTTYSVSGVNAYGCVKIAPFTLNVDDISVPALSVDDSTITSSENDPQLFYAWYTGSYPNGTLVASGYGMSSYTATQNGTYYVIIVSDNGCTVASDPVTIGNLRLAGQFTSTIDCSIKPNPNNGQFTIFSAFNNEHVRITLTDVTGRTVKVIADEVLDGAYSSEIIAAGIPSGVYFIRIATPNGITVHRFVKQE